MVPVYGTENKNWFYVLIINILFIWKLQLPEENIYGKYVTKGDELSNCFSSWLNSQNLTSWNFWSEIIGGANNFWKVSVFFPHNSQIKITPEYCPEWLLLTINYWPGTLKLYDKAVNFSLGFRLRALSDANILVMITILHWKTQYIKCGYMLFSRKYSKYSLAKRDTWSSVLVQRWYYENSLPLCLINLFKLSLNLSPQCYLINTPPTQNVMQILSYIYTCLEFSLFCFPPNLLHVFSIVGYPNGLAGKNKLYILM